MSNPNPYMSPVKQSSSSSDAKGEVFGPAIALIVVSTIGIVVGLIGLGFDVFLIMSGLIDEMEKRGDGSGSEYTNIAVRSIWGILLIIAAIFVIYGAIKMKDLKSFGTAKAAAVVAVIPLLGPCCVLGIPFGIWALVVLSKPQVRSGFN